MIKSTLTLFALTGLIASAHARPPIDVQPAQAGPGAGSLSDRERAQAEFRKMAAEAVTTETVGDADSFGRQKTYLGRVQTERVSFQEDCSTFPPEAGTCITLNLEPASTSVDEEGLATISLPSKATNSLLCFTVTPIVDWTWENNTGSTQFAQFTVNTTVQVESEVLDGLTDPEGNPFNGQLWDTPISLSTLFEFRNVDDGHFQLKASRVTRSCIGGILSRSLLTEGFGLTDGQADDFFKEPMTVIFGTRGNTAMVSDASYFAGIRLYGD